MEQPVGVAAALRSFQLRMPFSSKGLSRKIIMTVVGNLEKKATENISS